MGLTKVFDLFVGGTPLPEPRHRSTATGKIYRSKNADNWINALQRVFVFNKPKAAFNGPLKIKCQFAFNRPKSIKDDVVWKDKKPDIDNLYKLIADQLEKAGIIENDSRFAVCELSKEYISICKYEGVYIQIWKL